MYIIRVLIFGIVLWLAILASQAAFGSDGYCEEDGETGFVTVDGSCMTPTRYDALFSVENLEDVYGEDLVATWGLDPTIAPSDRLLGEGLVETPRTFKQIVGGIYPI